MDEKLRTAPIGPRVTVRYRLEDGSATDAVGPIVERDDETIVVETRRRGEVRIVLATVIAARIIPS